MSAATIQTPILASQLREMADSLNSPHGGAIRTADIISLLYSAAEALSNSDAKYPDAIRDSLEQDWRELEATCTRLEEQQRRDGYRAGLLWWIVLLAAFGSLMFVVVDSLLKRKDNPYYPRYLAFKEREREKAALEGLKVAKADEIPAGHELEYRSLKHIDLRARRKVAKALLRDLWKVWRREANLVVPQGQADSASRPPSELTGRTVSRGLPQRQVEHAAAPSTKLTGGKAKDQLPNGQIASASRQSSRA